MGFQEQFVAGFMQKYLQTATDQELLDFVDRQVLSRLNPTQKHKLMVFITERVREGAAHGR